MSSTTKFQYTKQFSKSKENRGLHGLCDLSPTRWKCNQEKGRFSQEQRQVANESLWISNETKPNQWKRDDQLGHKTQKQDLLNKASQTNAPVLNQWKASHKPSEESKGKSNQQAQEGKTVKFEFYRYQCGGSRSNKALKRNLSQQQSAVSAEGHGLTMLVDQRDCLLNKRDDRDVKETGKRCQHDCFLIKRAKAKKQAKQAQKLPNQRQQLLGN